MKQTILRYGLLSGALAAVLMVGTALRIRSSMNFENEYIYGYAGILLSMLFVFFGVRAYREQVNGGLLSFGKGFQVGLLIAIVSCICYSLAWMVVEKTLIPDFMEKFMQHAVAQMQQSGTSQAEIERQTTEMLKMKEMYQNPLVKFGLTFLEPFPVGFLVSLITAIALRKQAA